MPPRGRGSRTGGGGRSGSGPWDSKPAAGLRRIMPERQSCVEVISGSKSEASEGASQSVPRSVSSSSSSSFYSSLLPTEVGRHSDSDCDSEYAFFVNNEFRISSDNGDSDDGDGQIGVFQLQEEGKKLFSLAESLPCHGLMLLLFETPSGFALSTFYGLYCYLDSAVDYLWAHFGDPVRASMVVYPKGFLSFEDKSSAINADTGIDNQLVALINKWHHPGMNLCVGKPKYKAIIESVLKIPCMYCQTGLEIMWGIQQQMHTLVCLEKSKLTKEDRLPTSQGLMKFLINCGFDVKPEMVNEKIFLTACALFHCDADDKRNLGLLRDAALHIRDISGIACEDWDILKLAIAVKVICCPKKELTDFHEVLADDVVSKLKGDAHKYKGVAVKVNWLNTYHAVVSNHRLRIVKKKMLGSLVRIAKEADEAEQAEVCEKVKLHGESKQIAQDHVTSVSNPTTLIGDPTILVGETVRRSPRLKRKLYENSAEGTPHRSMYNSRCLARCLEKLTGFFKNWC